MMFSFLVCFEFVWFLVPDLKTRLHARLFGPGGPVGLVGRWVVNTKNSKGHTRHNETDKLGFIGAPSIT